MQAVRTGLTIPVGLKPLRVMQIELLQIQPCSQQRTGRQLSLSLVTF